MNGFRRRRVWRRLASCIIAYAFALQMLLLAFSPPPALGLGADQDALNAALCSHDKSAPAAPVQNSGGGEHCKFCPAGGHAAFTPPGLPHHSIVRTADAAAPAITDAFAPRAGNNPSAQPRGPPQTA